MASELTPILIGTPPRTRAFFIKYVDLTETTPAGESILSVQAAETTCNHVEAALKRDPYIQFEGPTGLVHFRFGDYIHSTVVPFDGSYELTIKFTRGVAVASQ